MNSENNFNQNSFNNNQFLNTNNGMQSSTLNGVNDFQQPINNKPPKKINLGIVIGCVVVAAVAVVIWLFLTMNNDNNVTDNELNNKNNNELLELSITDTLPLEKSFNNLNWYYNEENSNDVWNFNVDIFSNNIKTYSNTYKNAFGEMYYTMQFSALINENSSKIVVQFGTENLEIYKKDHDMSDYLSDFTFYEDGYNNYDIITTNRDLNINMYYELSENYYLVITIQKTDYADDLKMYESYYKNFIDTINVKKYSKDAFKDTTYLNLIEQGWYSAGGAHLHLNSKKVTMQDMVLNFEGYGVSAINNDVESRWKDHVDYALSMMKDTPTYNNDNDVSYFNFDILYVSNANDDGVIKDYLNQEKFDSSEVKFNDYDFIYYKDSEGYYDLYMFETDSGYYLFINVGRNKSFEQELLNIIE